MAQWFIVRDGKETGPFNSGQLKDLAVKGLVVATDLVRRDDMKAASPAGKVRGLFANAYGQHAPPMEPEPPCVIPVLEAPPAPSRPSPPPLPSATAAAITAVLTPPPLPNGIAPVVTAAPADPPVSPLAQLRQMPIKEQRGIASGAGAAVGLVLWPFCGGFFSLTTTGAIFGLLLDVMSEKTNLGIRLAEAPYKFLACVVIGLVMMVHSDAIGDPAGGWLSFGSSKLGAFRKVVKKYKSNPGDYASTAQAEAYKKDLDQLQEAFFKIKFDPKKNRSEARAIVELWRSEIEGRYTGECPRLLENHVMEIYEKLRE